MLPPKLFLLPAFCLFAVFIKAQPIDSARINALWIYAHRIHEDSAVRARALCLEVIEKSQQAGYLKGQGDACVTLGVICRNNGEFPESYRHFRQALNIRRNLGDTNRIAAVFTNLAINMREESRYDSAMATVLYAIRIVEAFYKPDYTVLGSGYLLLSNICDEYLEPEDALKYGRKSLFAYTRTNKSDLIGKAAYALANRFLHAEQLDSALIYYDQAYNNFIASTRDANFLANILTNKGIIYTRKGDLTRAGEWYRQAQQLLDQMGDAADYFHFYLNKGDWFMAQSDYQGALDIWKKTLPDDLSELGWLEQQYLFENLASAYAALEKPDSAFLYQKAAYAVRDSIYNEHKRKVFIRFQAERYKKESAEQEMAAQQQASRARLFLQSSGLLLLLLLLIVYAYFQRKRAFQLIQRQQEKLHKQEVDDLIQNSELRYLSAGLEGRETEREQIARELHDQLGSAMVTLSWQYDAVLESTDRTSGNYQSMVKLNESLKQLYQDVRYIAHQLGSGVLERAGLIPVLQELCRNIEAGKKMEVNFSSFGMDNRIGFNHEVNILRIIQELISNILKYAKATQLMVQLNRIDDTINIMVEDNGAGFDQKSALQHSGTGLSNIEARLRGLHGTIQFENRPKGGTTVIINIPIPKPEKFYEQAY